MERKDARNRLASALVDYALAEGVTTYIAVAELGWYEQVSRFGWECSTIGVGADRPGKPLIAFRINISRETPSLMAAAGVYRPTQVRRLSISAGMEAVSA